MRPSWNWSGRRGFPTPAWRAGRCRFRRRPASTSSSRPSTSHWPPPRSAVAAGSSGILAGQPAAGLRWRCRRRAPPPGRCRRRRLGPAGFGHLLDAVAGPRHAGADRAGRHDVPPGGGNLSEIPAPLAFRRPRRPSPLMSFLGSPAVRVAGHIVAAVAGLGCGYLLLRCSASSNHALSSL